MILRALLILALTLLAGCRPTTEITDVKLSLVPPTELAEPPMPGQTTLPLGDLRPAKGQFTADVETRTVLLVTSGLPQIDPQARAAGFAYRLWVSGPALDPELLGEVPSDDLGNGSLKVLLGKRALDLALVRTVQVILWASEDEAQAPHMEHGHEADSHGGHAMAMPGLVLQGMADDVAAGLAEGAGGHVH